jgi:hypothetical protein
LLCVSVEGAEVALDQDRESHLYFP